MPDPSGNQITIRFYDDKNKEIDSKLVSIIDDKTFEISDELDGTEIFVYGQEVDDFRSLEKDSIYTITTAAVQQIDKEFQQAKQTIQSQQSQIQDLESKLASLEARLAAAGF
jgi:hypothetical protein